jgi:hypothetical protein
MAIDPTTVIERPVIKPESAPGVTSNWLNERQAADYIGVVPGTLNTWRCRGRGPRFHRVSGKMIRYSVHDLDAFMASKVVRS